MGTYFLGYYEHFHFVKMLMVKLGVPYRILNLLMVPLGVPYRILNYEFRFVLTNLVVYVFLFGFVFTNLVMYVFLFGVVFATLVVYVLRFHLVNRVLMIDVERFRIGSPILVLYVCWFLVWNLSWVKLFIRDVSLDTVFDLNVYPVPLGFLKLTFIQGLLVTLGFRAAVYFVFVQKSTFVVALT